MHFLFRLVAIVVMLVALTEWALVLRGDVRQFFASRASTSSASSDEDSRPSSRFDRDEDPRSSSSWTAEIQRFAQHSHSPASLFCFGAILNVLTRISWVQEQGKEID